MTPITTNNILYFAKNFNSALKFFDDNWFGTNAIDLNQNKLKIFFHQKKLLKSLLTEKRVLITKSRQMGVSSLLKIYCLWRMVHNPGIKILFVSTQLDNNYLVKQVFTSNKIKINNKNYFQLENGSSIHYSVPTSTVGRGHRFDLIIVDEAAYMNNLFNMLISYLSIGSCQLILASTPNKGSYFNELYNTNVNKINNWYCTEPLIWHHHPKFGENKQPNPYGQDGGNMNYINAWYEDWKRFMGEIKVAQELDCKVL